MSTDLYAKETLQNLAQLKELVLEQLKAFTLALTNRLNNSKQHTDKHSSNYKLEQ